MKVRAFLQLVKKRAGCQVLVDYQVGKPARKEVESHRRDADRQRLDGFQGDLAGVPIVRILAEANFIVDPPVFERVGAVAHDPPRLYPVVTKLAYAIHGHRLQGRRGAEIEKKWRGILQGDLESPLVERLDSHLGKIRVIFPSEKAWAFLR